MLWKWVLVAGLVTWVACSPASPPEPARPQGEARAADNGAAASSEPVELLFVQDAQGVEFGEGMMTLTGVRPTTLYFSDRPHRIAGHVTLESFLHTMAEHGTFSESPPNAVLVMLEKAGAQDIVVEIIERPTLTGDALSFPVRILDGEPPPSASSVSLFIDSAGEPDVWQQPGTISEQGYKQPGTISEQNYQQPGTNSEQDDQQPGEISDQAYQQPGTISEQGYKQPGTYGHTRYDVRGPYDSRGQKKEY